MRERLRRLVALIVGTFILYTAIAGPYDSLVQRSIMVALVITLGFLSFPSPLETRFRAAATGIDFLLWAGSMAACLFVTFNANWILTTLPTARPVDIAMTVVLVVTIVELARRTVGLAFPILIAVAVAYVFFGDMLPGRFGHRGFDINFFTETVLLSDLGVWGTLTGIASTIIAAFVLFGAMLLRTGGGETFMDLALLVSGRSVGGAAKMATVASASFGTVNGSAVANVATTGTMTIPLMKRIGYPPALAAAVEAVASTGGQITPPILGAAAFIMSEMIGMDYLRIALAAVIPAALFYTGLFTTVHLIALRNNVGYVPPEEIPSARTALNPVRLIPVVTGLGGLLWMLLSGHSVALSAAVGVVGMVVPFVIADLAANRAPMKTAGALIHGLTDAGTGIVIIALMLAGAQIFVSMLNLTGIGVTLSSLTVSVGGHHLFLVGLIVAVACLVLGMGIPTTAAYVLVAAVMAPALITLHVDPLVAHMFVFYYATISVITPPVCIAVFVAASLAATKWWPVAVNAVRLGAVTYVIPFMFLSYPGMLWSGDAVQIVEAALSGLALVLASSLLLSATTIRGSRMLAGVLYLPAAALAIVPSVICLIASVLLLICGIALGRPFRRQEPPKAGRVDDGGARERRDRLSIGVE